MPVAQRGRALSLLNPPHPHPQCCIPQAFDLTRHPPTPNPQPHPPLRERELAAVKVSPTDIDLLAAEAEVDKKQAERRLRECGGSLVAALKSYL